MRILVVSANENFRLQVQAACLRFGETNISLRLTDTVGQGMELAHQIEAEVVFLDLTRSVEAGLLAIAKLAEVRNRMVAASIDKLTPDVLTRAVRAGAQEILQQPPQEEEVQQILRKALRIQTQHEDAVQRTGRLVVSFSSKGGVGKTTLTVNVATALAQALGPNRVAIVDANTQAPNIAPMLDLRPQRWLKDAVGEYRRIDGEMLRGMMVPHPSGIWVLPHSTDSALDADFEEDQLSKILLVSKGTFDYTFVDTFPILSTLNLALMDLSDVIVLVTEAVVPSLRSARYNLQILRQAGYGPNRIIVVLNRYTRFRGNVPPDLVAETLDWPVDFVLPYDVHATIAANSGRALLDAFPNRALSDDIRLLAARITGEPVSSGFRESLLERGLKLLRGA